MKKKLLVLAMVALLLTGVFALSVSATTEEKAAYTCQCCGKAYSQVNWQPWTLTEGGSSNTITADAHYYLTGDVTTITAQIRIGDSTLKPKVTLDLRGHTMSSVQRVFGVYAGSTLSIVDSVGGGIVEGAQTGTSQLGGTIRINDAATLNLYGGTIRDKATKPHAAAGGVLSTSGNNCIINIAGATIQGGTYAPEGGVINATKGAKVNMTSGTVTGGIAQRGGSIFLNKATFTFSGGTINGGTAVEEIVDDLTQGNGGAIYAINSSVVNLVGGVINGGTADFGGAVFAIDNSKVTVDGATIHGGKAQRGGAFALCAASMDVKSGTINGGEVMHYGSAIHLLADNVNTPAIPCVVTISGGTINAFPSKGIAAVSMAANAHTVTMTGGEINGANVPSASGACFSGQGTGATITINGGTLSGVTSAKVDHSGLIYSRGKVVINGGTFNESGDGAAVFMYQHYGSLSMSSDMQTTLSGRVWLAENAKFSKGAAVSDRTNYIWYQTIAKAITAAKDGQIVKLLQSGNVDLQGKTLYLDINGYIPTVTNGHFYGIDSANDTYKASKCGYATGTATYEALTDAPDGRRYMASKSGSQVSFHRFHFGIEDVSLRTEMGREGIYFSSYFAGDEIIKAKISSFGIAMSKQNLGSDENWIAAMENGTAAYSAYSQSRFQNGVEPAKQKRTTGTLLKNIIHLNNSVDTNVANAQTTIYGKAYIRFTDGSYMMDAQCNTDLQKVLLWADANYNKLDEVQQAGLLMMYDRFMTTLNKIPTTYLRSIYDDQILTARRETVWQEMLDMNNILWTVDKEITYSFHASSKGIEQDLATQTAKPNHNPLSDDIGTFYPDRVYMGLPYTHASGNNSAIEQFGVRDENGVYHLTANPSMFTGGSTNGSNATTGAYNVARIGNDCWDMVHWAWSKVSTSVTADQTIQMTPDFGVLLVGPDILEKALRDNGVIDENTGLLDYICAPSTASATRGKLVYVSTATKLVRDGTRTKNADGTYDYQAMYQTYTMLQKGDAMVRYNSSGHAIMVGGVNVVYKDDGTIDGDKSTLLILEQGSANEEYQARLESEFSASVTNKHSSHTSVNKSCMYCCGYTDQVIDGKHVWRMDHPPQHTSFKKLAESYYIGVTCAELGDNTPSEKPLVSYNNTSNAVSYIYSGNLVSNYRISTVTLDIFNDKGELVNTSSIFGIQNGVRGPLYLNRYPTDQTAGAYGSVVAGTPALRKDGTRILTDLPAGNYTYRYSCQLGTEQWFEFANGSFTVNANGIAS